jgi:hypothetical protein
MPVFAHELGNFFAATHHRRCGARMEMMEILHFQCFLWLEPTKDEPITSIVGI